MKKEDKQQIIEQIAANLQEYENFYLTDIATLNAVKTSNLRRECSNRRSSCWWLRIPCCKKH